MDSKSSENSQALKILASVGLEYGSIQISSKVSFQWSVEIFPSDLHLPVVTFTRDPKISEERL